ncbi:hypothetical protein V2J09_016702 [Rumex salicifolius]
MGGKVKGKHRLDKFYHLAKEQGYRSRAAFKLTQLDAKYSFLPGAHSVLDLCAAPGGWMQVAVQRIPVGSLVVGIDLFPIRPVRGAIAVQEDITQSKCRSTIKKLLSDNHVAAFDVVLHDGSPNVGGAWAQEATSQNSLVIDSLKLATEFLAPKGTFVTKIFRSQDYNKVLFCLRQLFEKVEATKPAASRSTSAEIFIVCRKYKAPAKIDPRLLDVKHLFQEAIEPEKVTDVLRDSKQKRSRGGYKDDIALVRKDCSAADFVWSESPLDLLGTATVISFKAPDSLPIKDHELTTEEIEALCDDLGVLGKKDFKQLLKWRMNIRKALRPSIEPSSTSVKSENETKDDEEVDEDEKILNEMEELTHAMDKKKKREKKVLAKRRAKDKARKALGKQIDATEDGYVDEELFSLASIKGKKDLATVDDVTEEADDEVDFSKSERNSDGSDDDLSSDLDSDDERMRYDNKLEMLLDEAYESFVAKREGSTMQRKRAKQAYEDAQLSDVDEDMNLDDSDKDEENIEANPLVVPMNDQPPTEEEITATWFSQDIFAGVDNDEDVLGLKPKKDDAMEIDDQPDHKDKVSHRNNNKPKDSSLVKKSLEPPPKASKTEQEDDFEIVPAPATDSSDDSSSSDDESDYDDDAKAEIVACAKKMLRKKQRELILDDAYNKYMFHDDNGLPKWFTEEEKKHRLLQKPVTKEEVDAIKAQFKEINTRPVKKVAEAKARKKRVAMRQMEKIRKKANTISDQSDLPDRSKRRMIEQLYKKAAPQRPKKEYVVAKKGVQVRAGKGKVLVDRRMKSDARKQGGKSSKGKKGGKGKEGGKGNKDKGPLKSSGRKAKPGGGRQKR